MQEKTNRIFKQMLVLLDQYRLGEISLRKLVDGLEGGLNALEERLPSAFYTKWYNHWGKLEEILAVSLEGFGAEDKSHQQILEEAAVLRSLLGSEISGSDEVSTEAT